MRSGETFTEEILAGAERTVCHKFKDRSLLETALTHSSYSNVHGGESNERLEFLGDAVLELLVSEEIYREYPEADEGKLTALRQQYVSRTALEKPCLKAGLPKYMRYLGGEDNVRGKTASNLFEAVLGALFLDGGAAAAKRFLWRYLTLSGERNYKSLLQEYVQEREKKVPSYETREEGGKHVCTVRALGAQARGEGASHKEAETSAAKQLYRKLTERT